MSQEKAKYQPLWRQDNDSETFESEYSTSRHAASLVRWKTAVGVQSLIIIAILIFNLFYTPTTSFRTPFKDSIYSPVEHLVRYKNVLSSAGILSDKTPYQGPPNDETNALWEDLYSFGLSKIPTNDASKLVNRTIPIVGDPGNYIVTIDVFHQLHCLNMMRLFIWKAEDEHGYMNMIHMDHCIDSIRQSLMCSSPIAPMPFVWHTDYALALPPTKGIMRTCRDFNALRDWAIEREADEFDVRLRPSEDPLGEVMTQNDGQPRSELAVDTAVHLHGGVR